MADPYRPTYYPTAPTAPPHQDYAPQASTALTQQRRPSDSPYGPPAIYAPAPSNDYLSTNPGPLNPNPSSSHKKHSSHRSRSSDPRYETYEHTERRSHRSKDRRGDKRGDRGYSGDRSGGSRERERGRLGSRDRGERRGHSREKSAGATLAGAVGGGYLGHELGGGAIGTIGGLVAGAWGAREIERRHEKHKRDRSTGGSRSRPGSGHGHKSSIAGFVDGAQKKVENLLNPDSARDEKRDGRRRRRERETRSLSRGRYDDYESDEESSRRRR